MGGCCLLGILLLFGEEFEGIFFDIHIIDSFKTLLSLGTPILVAHML